MERILSQQEIDELIRDLAAEQSGQAEAPSPVVAVEAAGEVAPYDFRRPSKFSRDQLRSLERIHQQFGRLLGIMLGALLRTDLAARVVSVQQLTYGEFIRSVPNPSLLGVFDFGQAGDRIVLELSLDLGFNIYERLAGGSGSAHVGHREPTDIELQVLRRQVLGIIGDAYRQAWGAFLPLAIELRDVEINPTYINLVLDQDVILWISLEAEMTETRDTLNLCLPYSALEPLLPKLSNEYLLRAQGKPHSQDRERLHRLLRDTMVPVQAVLGTADLEIRELMELKVGDVLILDTGIHEEIKLYVANRPKFRGRAGRVGHRLAVRLTGAAQEASAELEEEVPDGTAGQAAGSERPAAAGAAAAAAPDARR